MKKEEEEEKESQDMELCMEFLFGSMEIMYGIYICLDYAWNLHMSGLCMELMFRSVVSWYR